MNLSAPFIRRPVATSLLTLAIVLAGGVAYFQLPVAPLPQVDFPTISVSAGLPGASPEVMATAVAAPLEKFLGHIAGVNEMTSTSSSGSSSITLQFDLNRNVNGAARDVQAAINAARAYLPADMPGNPGYRKVNQADPPIMIIAISSGVYDRGQMYDAASTILQQSISQIEGVGQVNVGGGSLPAVRVDVNSEALNSFGLSMEDVRTMLSKQNANLAKGQLSDNGQTFDVLANDQLLRARDYKPLVVTYKNGAAVRLEDIANVQDSVENLRYAGFCNGQPSVVLIIFREPGANIIATVDRIRKMLPALRASIPSAMTLTVTLDRTTTIRASVRDVQKTLVIAILLVILIVFLFLRDWRVTLIPGVVVPVSLVGTFGVMYLFGYSIDNISLMALTISTGFVVDDAIVVIENISRHLELGCTPVQAALRGAKEVGFTVLSISVSLVAVFIPILMMGGILGRLFHEFAVTLSAAILVSLAVSLSTTPMMCSKLLRHRKSDRPERMGRLSEKFFQGVLGIYEQSLRWVLRHTLTVVLLLVATVLLNIYLMIIVPKGLFPIQDNGTIVGGIQGPQDASFNFIQKSVSKIVNIIKSDPAVEDVTAFTGSTNGSIFISLKPLKERKVGAGEVIGRLRGKLYAVPGVSFYGQPGQDIRIGGRQSFAMFQFTIQGDDVPELMKWGNRLLTEMRKLPEITDVNSDQQNNGLQIKLEYDRQTAARLGISPSQIDSVLYDSFGQRQVSTMFDHLNQYHVVMEAAPRLWQNPDGIKGVYLRSSSGKMVPLDAVAKPVISTMPLGVSHQGQFPSVTISFNLAPGVSLGQAKEAVERLVQAIGMPGKIHGFFAGVAQAFNESLKTMPILILAALVAVYIVLGILYESFIHPITIISTLPSAGVGGVLALMISGCELGMFAMIGMLLLIGIVKKNAILMIDFALAAERDEGKDPKSAIFEACLLRFRPILMTTMAALMGALPLVFGDGPGSELRKPMGITILGGLILSQVLTLYTTPVVYLYLDRLRIWLAMWRRVRVPNLRAVIHGN